MWYARQDSNTAFGGISATPQPQNRILPKGTKRNTTNVMLRHIFVVRPAGFEPAIFGSGGQRLIPWATGAFWAEFLVYSGVVVKVQ